MRQARASFLLLLFVTSYARCWAGTHGLLDSSSWATCQPAIEEEHDCHGHDHYHQEENSHDPEPFPSSDCSGCSLTKAGYTTVCVDIGLTAPVFTAIIPEWDDLDLRVQRMISCVEDALEPPPPWSIGQVILTTSEIVATTAISVRGPNLG